MTVLSANFDFWIVPTNFFFTLHRGNVLFMVLTDEEKKYKVPIVKEGSKLFFAINSAKNWDFESYFESTHNDINKYKQVAKVKTDYDADLSWIRQLAETPIAIKEYAFGLIKKEKVKKKRKKKQLKSGRITCF